MLATDYCLELKYHAKNRLMATVARAAKAVANGPWARVMGANPPVKILCETKHNVIRKEIL
jgi:hypothetical protein